MMKHLRHILYAVPAAFIENKRAVAAVEFALILPVMVVIYVSTVEISMAVAVQRKVAITAGTLGDLVAQQSSVTDGPSGSLADILSVTRAVMLPYKDFNANVTATVTSVKMDGTGNATVDWSKSWKVAHGDLVDGPYNHGDSYDLSAAPDLEVANTSIIVAEFNYEYTSPLGYIFTTARPMTHKTYFRPRLVPNIEMAGTAPTTAWTLATTGPISTHINPNYAGYGTEYAMAPRGLMSIDENGIGEIQLVPQDLQNAWYCDTGQTVVGPGGVIQPLCNHLAAGSGGGSSLPCFASDSREVYWNDHWTPLCYAPQREPNAE